jgi:glycosyltransferase 2 family protein
MKPKQLLRWCGLALSVLMLIWIGLRFVRSGALALLGSVALTPLQLTLFLLAGALGYALNMSLPALGWWRLVSTLSPQSPPLRQTMATYAVSQYGKYLPGNVAHYALRHIWSRRYGIPHESLGLAAMLEAALFLLTAFALTLVADVRGHAVLSFVDARMAVALLSIGLIVLVVVLRWIRQRGGIAGLHVPYLPPSMLLACAGCYGGFFLLCTLLLAGLAHVLGIGVPSYAMLLGATAASWLAGFLVIGAPAGLGVREAVFVALAGASLGESHALLLIGLYRVLTFLGDSLFLAAGALALRLDARRSAQGVA